MHSVSPCNGLVALMKTMVEVEGSSVHGAGPQVTMGVNMWGEAHGQGQWESGGGTCFIIVGFCLHLSLIGKLSNEPCPVAEVAFVVIQLVDSRLKSFIFFLNQSPFLQHLSSGNAKKALRKGLSSASCRREVHGQDRTRKGCRGCQCICHLPQLTIPDLCPSTWRDQARLHVCQGVTGRCRKRKGNMQMDKNC